MSAPRLPRGKASTNAENEENKPPVDGTESPNANAFDSLAGTGGDDELDDDELDDEGEGNTEPAITPATVMRPTSDEARTDTTSGNTEGDFAAMQAADTAARRVASVTTMGPTDEATPVVEGSTPHDPVPLVNPAAADVVICRRCGAQWPISGNEGKSIPCFCGHEVMIDKVR